MSIIKKVYKTQQVMEGAGVKVNRVFGNNDTSEFDPFLMLDYFNNPDTRNSPGFPWHPHKGIETITYMLKGKITHEDSVGNKGTIAGGELQWMTSGKGIYHQEMPGESPEGIQGFQFWVNMKSSEKLNEPNYQYINNGEMKSVVMSGVEVRVISGEYRDVIGPIDKSSLGITMLHVSIKAGSNLNLIREKLKQGYIFVFEGDGQINDESIEQETAYTLGEGKLVISANSDMDFIFAEGKPLKEPVAWHGPVVMNTWEEIEETFNDLRNGTFAEGYNV